MNSENNYPIVGIGASAGGIPALEGFFRAIPADCGMAFVIVTHLSPERPSLLHEVIQRFTELPVKVADNAALVEINTVYVMPENAVLTIEGGRLRLRKPDSVTRERKPVDIFFASLAQDKGEQGAAVILSGGDSDGTLGIKAIKEHGGLTLAQEADGSGPRNPDMPRNAIASGLVDIAVPVEQMGPKLMDFASKLPLFATLEQEEDAALENQQARNAICAILRSHSGHDFSGYKSKTFFRRVRRRMQVTQTETIGAYVEWLKQEADEVGSLFRDLLINVTGFFRDPDAFKALEETVIPAIFAGRGAHDTVRVWVPGCATGEEAFSIGILAREHMDRLTVAPRVQIFATDIDDPALGIARAARYQESALEGLSPARRKRFFTRDGNSFLIAKDIREMCVFSPHSVIREPPFSRMDLVSCRNLLIYFGPDIQNQVLPTFHYALKPGGYLFLGTSESVGQHSELFATVDKKSRIFQAREHSRVTPRVSMFLRSSGSGQYAPADWRRAGQAEAIGYPLRQAVEGQVLDRHTPAHVVVNSEGDVVYYSPRTGKYLEPAPGAPNRQLLTMARRGLRLELRTALREAMETRRPISRENVLVDDDDEHAHAITLTVEPLADRGGGEALYLVLFVANGILNVRGESANTQPSEGTLDLERELRDTRERLQATIEEYETALEELKSSNEELVSVNEEAQSTNEELEASKEEMQSLNEELNTINAELTEKVEELDRANSDLRNLFESTKIATIFLDRHLVIRNFTPAASTFFKLRSSDIGRPLTDLASRLDYPELKDHIEQVFGSGEMIEHQLARDADNNHYLVRLIPYRDGEKSIYGVVVTLVDVTSLAQAEAHQRTLIAELNHRVKNMLAVVISIANHTLRSAPSPESFNNAFVGRLHAMSRTYGLLSRESWKNASVEQLVRQEVEPFGLERVSIAGPELKLRPDQSLSIGMVVHELATNAVKYGSLSSDSGRVLIGWSQEDGRFQLTWQESGGPRINEPPKNGFGLDLLKGEIVYRHGGTVETAFKPGGLEVTIEFSISGRQAA